MNYEKKIDNIVSQSININSSGEYIIIDVLYLSNFRNSSIENESLDTIKKILFPYNDTPFAHIFLEKGIYSINYINQFNKIVKNHENVFSTDTGLVLVLNIQDLDKASKTVDYELLVESANNDIIDIDYWNNISKSLNEIWLIAEQNEYIETYLESGTYKIQFLKC